MILKKQLKKISKTKYMMIIDYLQNYSNLECVTTYNMHIFATRKLLNDYVNYKNEKIKEVLEEDGYECDLNDKELEKQIKEEVNKAIESDDISLENPIIYLKNILIQKKVNLKYVERNMH